MSVFAVIETLFFRFHWGLSIFLETLFAESFYFVGVSFRFVLFLEVGVLVVASFLLGFAPEVVV
jgi:hypothetical protein